MKKQSLSDHLRQAEQRQILIYSSMTYKDKYEELLKLRAFAWEIKRAGIKAQHPELNELEIEERVKKIFLYATT